MSGYRFLSGVRRARRFLGLLALLAAPHLHAADFFDDQQAVVPMERLTAVAPGTTLGGYAIYPNGNQWHFLSSRVDESSERRYGRIVYGSVSLLRYEGNDFLAQMDATVILTPSVRPIYWTDDPCSGEHLLRVTYAVNTGNETTFDNCLTVDPYVATIGKKSLTTLATKITNRQSGTRYYVLNIHLNPAALGQGDTVAADWTRDALAQNPARAMFFSRVTDWAKKLQAGVNQAIAFSKPQDAFKDVPPLRSLKMDPASLAAVAAPTSTLAE